MKAGIYRSPNGNLIYVAKDRTVKATNLSPSTWPGMKVSHRAKDDTVTLCDYTFTRFADVPNGCTDHAKALADASATNKAEILEVLGLPADLKDGESMADWALRCGKGNKPGYEYRHVVNENPIPGGEDGKPNMIFTSGDANPLGLGNEGRRYTVTERRPALAAPYSGPTGTARMAEAADAALALGDAFKGVGDAARGFFAPFVRSDASEQAYRQALKESGYRFCHGASARKHRKHGDVVISLGHGRYAWKPPGKPFAYQDAAFMQTREASRIDLPIGAGKSLDFS